MEWVFEHHPDAQLFVPRVIVRATTERRCEHCNASDGSGEGSIIASRRDESFERLEDVGPLRLMDQEVQNNIGLLPDLGFRLNRGSSDEEKQRVHLVTDKWAVINALVTRDAVMERSGFENAPGTYDGQYIRTRTLIHPVRKEGKLAYVATHAKEFEFQSNADNDIRASESKVLAFESPLLLLHGDERIQTEITEVTMPQIQRLYEFMWEEIHGV